MIIDNHIELVNSVHFGDCLDIMPMIQDKFIDMIFCDLPYGTTNCSWDSIIDLTELWAQYSRIIKDNGAILLSAQTPFDKVLGCSNLNMLRYEWIWEKTNATGHLNAKRAPMKAHENILVFYKRQPIYNPIKTYGHIRKTGFKKITTQSEVYNKNTSDSMYDSTERYPRSVQVFKSDKQTSKIHPTQKPVALVEYFIKTYTNPGAIVLDNCSGSGTTGLAAKNTGRNYIMIDKEHNYFTQSKNRVL